MGFIIIISAGRLFWLLASYKMPKASERLQRCFFYIKNCIIADFYRFVRCMSLCVWVCICMWGCTHLNNNVQKKNTTNWIISIWILLSCLRITSYFFISLIPLNVVCVCVYGLQLKGKTQIQNWLRAAYFSCLTMLKNTSHLDMDIEF